VLRDAVLEVTQRGGMLTDRAIQRDLSILSIAELLAQTLELIDRRGAVFLPRGEFPDVQRAVRLDDLAFPQFLDEDVASDIGGHLRELHGCFEGGDGMSTTIQRDAHELRETLGLSYTQGSIAIGADSWIVFIWGDRKKPPLIKWKGKPVVYRIGGGMAKAYAA